MTVLKGEGTHNILYGSSSINMGTRSVPVYLARPDVRGSFPTVVVSHDVAGVASWLKDFARKLARHGFSVIVPDLYRGQAGSAWPSLERAARSLRDGYEFSESDDVPWASGDRLVVIGFGEGGPAAVQLARQEPSVAGLVMVSVPDPGGGLDLSGVPVSMLGIYGSDTEPPQRVAHMELVKYGGIKGRFLDDDGEDFDWPASLDVVERITDFVGKANAGGR